LGYANIKPILAKAILKKIKTTTYNLLADNMEYGPLIQQLECLMLQKDALQI
jgi:hypothetical protein